MTKPFEITLGIIGGAAVIAAGVFIYKRFRKNYVRQCRVVRENNNSTNEEEIVIENVKAEFISNAEAFCGLYEPVYRLAQGKRRAKTGVFADFYVRVNNLSGAEELIEFWNSNFSDYEAWDEVQNALKAQELLRFFNECGAARDNSSEITIDNSTYKKYSTEDGEIIESGLSAKVILPCWYLRDFILEKGIISKIEDLEE